MNEKLRAQIYLSCCLPIFILDWNWCSKKNHPFNKSGCRQERTKISISLTNKAITKWNIKSEQYNIYHYLHLLEPKTADIWKLLGHPERSLWEWQAYNMLQRQSSNGLERNRGGKRSRLWSMELFSRPVESNENEQSQAYKLTNLLPCNPFSNASDSSSPALSDLQIMIITTAEQKALRWQETTAIPISFI